MVGKWLPAGALMLAASTCAATSRGEGSSTAQSVQTYFAGELDEAAVFLGMGIGTAYVGSSLAAGTGDFGIGAVSAIVPISAIQIGAGLVLLARTRGQTRDLLALLRKSPSALQKAELPRMRRVSSWFDVYMGIEIGLVALGAGSIAFGVVDDRDGFIGAGVGLASQATAMLTLDWVASRRATQYLRALERVTAFVTPLPGGRGAALVAAAPLD